MAKEDYKGKMNFYAGADYGFDANYGKEFSLGLSNEYKFKPSQFGFTTDPRTANQVGAVSQKLNTGAKLIEVTAIAAQQLETIPKQHFKEIERLKKLVGADLTFHGPIVEPSGWGEGGWSETARAGSERQMWSAVERAQQLDSKGNIVITFHSTAGVPELATRIMTSKGEQVTEIVAYDERAGQTARVKIKENKLLNEKLTPDQELERMNKETWFRELSHLAFNTRQGVQAIEKPLREIGEKESEGLSADKILELYKTYKSGGDWEGYYNKLQPGAQKYAKELINNANFGEVYVRDSYNDLQDKFSKAFLATEKEGDKGKEDLGKLKAYREELQKVVKNIDFNDPTNLLKLGEEVQRGVNVLNSLSAPPQALKAMNDFIIDKSSESFANIAFNAYKKFKEHAPIISIENPPAGGGLSHGEDLRKLIEETRKKFEQQAIEKEGLSESEARRQAEKLIGVTWDVGHINMLRKYGYKDEHLEKQTEEVAEMVKHIHLSDNFGYEHTELPMGMGNVPMQGHLEALKKHGAQLDKIKKIVETGNWFEPFKITPMRETLVAFGSPIYSMQMGPAWNQASHASGGYFSGYGRVLPDQHFNLYGSGFSTLPTELGGQTQGRSRASGAPID